MQETTTAATPPPAPSPKAKKTKQSLTASPKPEVFSATAQDNSRKTLFFDVPLCCVTSVLKDIPEEHLSRTAFQEAVSRGLLFCWKKGLHRDHARTQPQPNNLQVDKVLKSWTQARRLIKDMLMHATEGSGCNMPLRCFLGATDDIIQ